MKQTHLVARNAISYPGSPGSFASGWLPVQKFQFPGRVCPGDQLLIKEPDDSRYEIARDGT